MEDAHQLLKKFPKTDLHCHLDGSLKPETIMELMKKQGAKLPTENIKEFKKYVQVSDNCRSLTEFLNAFEFFYPYLKNPQAVERMSYEICEICKNENIKYLEARFAPALQATEKFPIDEVVKTAINGFENGKRDYKIAGGIIICIYRNVTEEENWKTVDAILKYYGNGVVGVDLAGDESKYSTGDFEPFFKKIKDAKIPITSHAGEAKGPESISEALKLGAKRLGHATNLINSDELMKVVKNERIPIEVCLTSNLQTQVVKDISNHPFKKFYDYGLILTLNTDDRGVSGISLTNEYELALKNFNLKISDCIKLIMNGVESSFLSENEKKSLYRDFKTEIEQILKNAT